MAEEKKNTGIYLDNVSAKMIHEREGKNGKFYSVGVGFDGRIGNISVSEKSVHDSKSNGRKNVWLSNDPNYQLNVYFSDTKSSEKMSAQAIHDAYEAGFAKSKAGKTEEAPAKDAPAKEEKSSDVLWLNGVSPKLIHERMGQNGPFYSVAFDYKGGLANFTATPKQVRDGKDGRKDVILGSPDQVKHVSFKGEDGNYEKIDMTAREVLDSAAKGREEYKAAAKEAEATEERTE